MPRALLRGNSTQYPGVDTSKELLRKYEIGDFARRVEVLRLRKFISQRQHNRGAANFERAIRFKNLSRKRTRGCRRECKLPALAASAKGTR